MSDSYVIGPDGRPYRVDTEQARDLSELGGTQTVSKADAQAITGANKDIDYVDQNWGTVGKALAGLGNELSVGIGGGIASRLGWVDPGHLEAMKHSTAGQVGGAVGLIAPALFTGGESLAARGALAGGELAERGAGSVIGKALRYATPAGWVGEAGGAAERLVGRFAGEAGLMGKLGKPTLQMAARGATEGALINMAHTTSDAIINDKPFTAAALASSGVNGFLFGGAVGGIMGGASALVSRGAETVGGAVTGRAAGEGGEASAAKAFNRLTDGSQSARTRALDEFGSLRDATKNYVEVLEDSGLQRPLAQGTGAIRDAAAKGLKVNNAVAEEVLTELQKDFSPVLNARLGKIADAVEADVKAKFATSPLNREAGEKLGTKLGDDIYGTVSREPFAGKVEPARPFSEPVSPRPEYGSPDHAAWVEAESTRPAREAQHNAAESLRVKQETEALREAKKAYDSLPKVIRGNGTATWEGLAKSRQHLADMAKTSTGTTKELYSTALNAYDREFRAAMEQASPDLANKYAAAVEKARLSRDLVEMTNGRAAMEAGRASPIHMDTSDAATITFSAITGANPLVAGGIIAGKKLIAHAQQAFEPAVAEAAYRASIGDAAAKATLDLNNRIVTTVKTFLSGGGKEASAYKARHSLSYSPKAMADSAKAADDLTSVAHQQRVKDLTSALSMAGHEELANEMLQQYGRTVAYVNAAKEKVNKERGGRGGLGTGGKFSPMLTKPPKQLKGGFSTAEGHLHRVMHAVMDPQDAVLGGIERGDVSREAVAAVAYISPPFIQKIQEHATSAILEKRMAGEFVPADKVVTLGIALNSAVDNSVTPEFVASVQEALAANKAPPPKDNAPPPGPTDISAFQTPLQTSIT